MAIPIRGRSWGTPEYAFQKAKERGAKRLDFTEAFIHRLYADCAVVGVRADVMVAQWDVETGWGTSSAWVTTGNPGGLGIFDDGSTQGLAFTPETGARAFVTHMLCYLGIEPPEGWKVYDARWDAAVAAGYFGSVKTTADLGKGRWATDPEYGRKIESRHAAYRFTAPTSSSPPQPTEDTDMALTAYTVPGLSKPVYFPSGLAKVTIDLVPAARRNIRSNQRRSASQVTKYTQHETANFSAGAGARMHRNYLHSGAGGSYVGFNSVNDDRELIVLTPYDEVTWAAGTSTGNLVSDHAELCVNAGINHTKARQVAAAWAAGVIHARGLTVAQALVQHNVWFGKNCPLVMRRDGIWPSFVNMVARYYNDIATFLKSPNTPAPVSGLKVGDTVKTTDVLNLRQGWGTGSKVVTTLPAETVGTIKDGPESASGYIWYDIEGAFGSGWVAADWLSKTTPQAPTPEPSDAWPYPDPVVPPFWDALMKDGATFVQEGDVFWFRTNDLYRVKKETKRQQFAIADDRVVGPTLKAGDEFRGAAVGHSAMDNEAWVITPGLTRVRLADLAFVDDEDTHDVSETADALVEALNNALGNEG